MRNLKKYDEMGPELCYTVCMSCLRLPELVKRYLATKTGVKPTTEDGYKTVVNMDHSNIRITLDIYTHLKIEDAQAEFDRVMEA